uniref:Cystatin domain-containing protein n=1 Tax=Glossina pallidipes TaxID=7398 RepID=A0A1B0A8C7_GLOPL
MAVVCQKRLKSSFSTQQSLIKNFQTGPWKINNLELKSVTSTLSSVNVTFPDYQLLPFLTHGLLVKEKQILLRMGSEVVYKTFYLETFASYASVGLRKTDLSVSAAGSWSVKLVSWSGYFVAADFPCHSYYFELGEFASFSSIGLRKADLSVSADGPWSMKLASWSGYFKSFAGIKENALKQNYVVIQRSDHYFKYNDSRQWRGNKLKQLHQNQKHHQQHHYHHRHHYHRHHHWQQQLHQHFSSWFENIFVCSKEHEAVDKRICEGLTNKQTTIWTKGPRDVNKCWDKQTHNENDDDGGQPVSEKPIKVVHVLQPGEREYLSPNLIGVQNIAMTFLPLTMNFINIIDAYREIVNGIRYEILLNAINTEDNDADIVCRLVILEKPWLRTQWGDKVRELQHTNCTSSTGTEDRADNLPNPANNNINDKYVKSTVFNGGSRNELSNDDIKRLEDQIFPSAISSKRDPSRSHSTHITSSSTAASVEKSYDESDKVTSNESPNEMETTTASPHEISLEEIETSSTSVASELSEDDKQWLDNFFSIGALSFENSRRDATLTSSSSSSSSSSKDNNEENTEIASDASDNSKQQQRAPEQKGFSVFGCWKLSKNERNK